MPSPRPLAAAPLDRTKLDLWLAMQDATELGGLFGAFPVDEVVVVKRLREERGYLPPSLLPGSVGAAMGVVGVVAAWAAWVLGELGVLLLAGVTSALALALWLGPTVQDRLEGTPIRVARGQLATPFPQKDELPVVSVMARPRSSVLAPQPVPTLDGTRMQPPLERARASAPYPVWDRIRGNLSGEACLFIFDGVRGGRLALVLPAEWVIDPNPREGSGRVQLHS